MSEEFEEEFEPSDWEPTPEEIAQIEQGMQDLNDGFGYEMLNDDEGKLTWTFKCLKCGRIAELHERPFPHKLECPMRKYFGDKD
jgi:hypothetical protein